MKIQTIYKPKLQGLPIIGNYLSIKFNEYTKGLPGITAGKNQNDR